MLLAFILAAMTALAPNRDHSEIADILARVITAERPLFQNDNDRKKTAALIVAVGFRESGLRMDAVSKTNDYCLMQINHRPDLVKFPEACIRVGIAMMRESMRVCPAHPLSFYAEGPRGCASARAQRISKDRMALAARLAKVTP